MNLLPHADLSLYIHVPFCTNRCRYCGFYLETTSSPILTRRFVDLLLEEARLARDGGWILPGAIRTIYVGGGTPSLLPAALLERLFTGLREIFAIEFAPHLDEFCFEANPESIDAQKLELLASLGVDRISLGVQSFDEACLRLLDRRANPTQIRASLDLLAERWPGSFGADIISGIPGRDRFASRQDIRQLLAWQPQHISLYDLSVEDNTALAQLAALPPSRGGIPTNYNPTQKRGYEEGDIAWHLATEELEQRGYPRYELSNFAKKEHQSAHNLRYWNMTPWLGLGPGSVSNLHTAQGALRIQSPDLFAYRRPATAGKAAGFKADAAVELVLPRAYLSEHILTGTRTTAGLDLDLVDSRFPLSDQTSCSLAFAGGIIKLNNQEIQVIGRRLLFTGQSLTYHNASVLALDTALDSVLIDSPGWCP